MLECGSMNQPPSFSNITIWGIITLVIMLIVGIYSILGFIDALKFGNFLFSIVLLIGNGFGVAGLIFAILAIVQRNGNFMKIAALCFLVSCIVNIVVLVFSIVKFGFYYQALLEILLDVFLCYLFWVQSSGYSSA